MRTSRAALFLTLSVSAAAAQAEHGWLAASVSPPEVARSAQPFPVVTRPLERKGDEGIGLYPAVRAGLSEDMWRESSATDLAAALAGREAPMLHATQGLLHRMLEAEATPPSDSQGEFLLTRVDALISIGALGSAGALLTRVERPTALEVRREFDVAILTGSEAALCDRIRRLPEITPTYPARIFCLARTGDWPAAAVTLVTAHALGVVTPAEMDRLLRFLDEEAEGAFLPPPARPTPLDFVLYEAVGEPISTAGLPIAFAHADLRDANGWKARIAAAERLARAGAITPARLWKVYGEGRPAASGHPWDRVAAVQALRKALRTGEGVDDALVEAWQLMLEARLAPVMAAHLGAEVASLQLSEPAGAVARRMALLSSARNEVARRDVPDGDGGFEVLAAIAKGAAVSDAPTGLAQAVRDGLDGASVPAPEARLLEAGRTGEAILAAIDRLDEAAGGSLDAARDGLATLRAAGLHEDARAAALELLISERRP